MAGRFNLSLIPEQAEKHFEANRKVLVIEDDRLLGDMIFETLADVGFAVTRVVDGKTAFKALKQQPIDFIILDLLLPEMNGFQIYQKLREQAETKDMPVMIITAWSDEHNLERASQLGIQHFLPKPFTEDELLFSILSLLIDSSYQKA